MSRRKAPSQSGTPALIRLIDSQTPHTVHEFPHDPAVSDFGNEAALALQVEPAQVFKTLIWQIDDGYCVGMVPASGNTAPKKLAAAMGARRAQLAAAADAERLSGSVLGAISPLGLRQTLRVVIDSSAVDHDQIFISAGRRGLEISLSPLDLIGLVNATVAPISS
jgi:Cys-tRNA(Pro)/Cys-tRNA(Cys) deacylase